jgi:hypothetical protein
MRITFLKNHGDNRKGDTINIDPGIAAPLIEQRAAKHDPLSDDELIAIASQPEPGDEARKPAELARRREEKLIILRRIN